MIYDFYDKLVRDNIPDIIRESGDIPLYRSTKTNNETIRYLSKKLHEETLEFLEEYNLTELADLIDVLEALIKTLGISKKQICEIRLHKNTKAGNFNNNIILEGVLRKMDINIFDDKYNCDVYIPMSTKNDELFLIELLDLCECYLEPLKYGIQKNDILEYFSEENSKQSFLEFLRFKRFIAKDSCFIDLAKTYMKTPECIKIIFKDINYGDIEQYFQENSLSSIREQKILNFSVGQISSEGEFIENE